MRHLICLLLLLTVAAREGWGQAHLLIAHPKRKHRASMRVGDLVSLSRSDGKVRGRLTQLDDSVLWITTETHMAGAQESDLRTYRQQIRLSEIMAIDKQHAPNWRRFQRLYSGTTMAGGSMVILGSSFNTLATDRPPSIKTLAIVGVVLTSGLVMRMLGRRQYRRKKGWHWEVVPAAKPDWTRGGSSSGQ
jgi:hypothetical protein